MARCASGTIMKRLGSSGSFRSQDSVGSERILSQRREKRINRSYLLLLTQPEGPPLAAKNRPVGRLFHRGGSGAAGEKILDFCKGKTKITCLSSLLAANLFFSIL